MANEMVSLSSILAMFLTLAICTVLPLAVYVIYGIKNKGKGVWLAWVIGAAGFFVLQIIIRLPILSVFQMIPGFNDFVANYYVLYCFILAITAAGFELAARLITAKIMSKSLTYEKGFAAGLGHGGIEAIVLIGSTYINNILYSIMINTGIFDTIVEQSVATGVDVASLEAVKLAFIETGPSIFLLAGYERILTMVAHLAMSLIVYYFWKKRRVIVGALICFALHTFIDFSMPIISGLSTDYLGNVISQNTAYIIIYSILTVVAVTSVLIIIRIKKGWKVLEGEMQVG